jgi:hypothetical protein
MTIRVSDDVLWRKVGDEVLMSNTATELIFGLDGAGARMWQVLAETGSIDETAAALAEEFDASVESIRADLHRLIEELRERGLVVMEQSSERVAAPKASPPQKHSVPRKRKAARAR